jgi:hypothetical protein
MNGNEEIGLMAPMTAGRGDEGRAEPSFHPFKATAPLSLSPFIDIYRYRESSDHHHSNLVTAMTTNISYTLCIIFFLFTI